MTTEQKERKERKEKEREREIKQTVEQLTTAFNKALTGTERAFRGKNVGPNFAYICQTEFAYLVDDIQRGPWCVFDQSVQAANDFIDSVITELAELRKAQQEHTKH